ncbi:MAG: hypothetical protein WDA22_14455 [Bacteroidota bacterium]
MKFKMICSIGLFCFLFYGCDIVNQEDDVLTLTFSDPSEPFPYSTADIEQFIKTGARVPNGFLYRDSLISNDSLPDRKVHISYLIPDSVNNSTNDSTVARQRLLNALGLNRAIYQTGSNEKYFQFLLIESDQNIDKTYYRINNQNYASIPKDPSINIHHDPKNVYLGFEAVINKRPITVELIKEFSEYAWTTWRMNNTSGLCGSRNYLPHIISEVSSLDNETVTTYTLYEVATYDFVIENPPNEFRVNKLAFNVDKQSGRVNLNSKLIRRYEWLSQSK